MGIRDKLAGIPQDKLLHGISCQLIAFYTARLVKLFAPEWIAFCAGFIIAVIIGIIKELIDSRKKDNFFDMSDVLADGIGASVGAIMSI